MLRGALLSLLIAAAAPASAQVAELAVKFGTRESFAGVAISPDGSKVSYLNPVGGKGTAAVVVDLATGGTKPVLSTGDPNVRIASCDWIKLDRLACRIVAEDNRVGQTIGYSRIMAVDATGENVREIGARQGSRSYGYNQFGGSIIDYLPSDPDNVLMVIDRATEESTGNLRAGNGEGGLTVARVNARTGQIRVIERLEPFGADFMSDGQGRTRIKVTIDRRGTVGGDYLGGTYRTYYRTKTGNDWIPLAAGNVNAADFSVLGFDESGDNILALKKLDGRQALYRIAADGTSKETLVFSHPKVDVDGVKRIGKSWRPVGATYSTDYNHVEWLDPAIAKLVAGIGKALPGQPEVTLIDETWDGSKLLLFAGSDSDPGAYYLFDRTKRSLGKLSPLRPQLAGLLLGQMKPVSYPARDGTPIPGYLTLPPGKEAKNLPAIVMPHGGPGARDTWGFDWLSQFYAQLGYAVLQPNFRGSTGFGDDWFQDNGFKSWKVAVSDVNDGARWLIAQGIADPKRVAIVGWSYGGYAALQANVVEPNLYKAAVAIAPVADLALFKEQFRNYSNFLLATEFIGSGPHITEGSPARFAASFKVPVLMFHGTRDLNVDIRQSRAMEAALKQAGKPVELVVYDNLEHSLIDTFARSDMLLRSAKFLQAHVK